MAIEHSPLYSLSSQTSPSFQCELLRMISFSQAALTWAGGFRWWDLHFRHQIFQFLCFFLQFCQYAKFQKSVKANYLILMEFSVFAKVSNFVLFRKFMPICYISKIGEGQLPSLQNHISDNDMLSMKIYFLTISKSNWSFAKANYRAWKPINQWITWCHMSW